MIGIIVEDVSGQPLNEYFEEHIFAPLGMADTELNVSIDPSPNQPTPYVFYPNGEAEAVESMGIEPFFA